MNSSLPTNMKTVKKTLYVVLVILCVAILSMVWKTHIRDRMIPRKWGVVVPEKIYRSGQLSAQLVEQMLQTHGIKVIVDLTYEDLPNEPEQQEELVAAEKLGIEHKRFPLRGWGTGKVTHYVDAVAAIDQAVKEGKPVLVHCTAGAQRTGGVLATYQMLIENRDPALVRQEMMLYGWDPEEDKFMLGYLNDSMELFAEMLVEKGVIDVVPRPVPQLKP